jgi:hypothetical protein
MKLDSWGWEFPEKKSFNKIEFLFLFKVLTKDFQEINNPLPSTTTERDRSPNAIEVINR